MREQYNFDSYAYDQTNAFDSTFMERNIPFANANFTTNMNPNTMASMNANMAIFPNSNDSNIINYNNNMNYTGNLADAQTGFMQGNLFNNLYVPYKNYRPMRLVPNNEQAEMLLNVGQLEFAAHELRLYLDVYPNDAEMIALFNQYRNEANQAVRSYEQKYGPLTWDALSTPNEFSWQATTWPWEMGVM